MLPALDLLFNALALARKYWRESAIGALALALAFMVARDAQGKRDAATARIVYTHPETKSEVSGTEASGASRKETNVKRHPDGSVETSIVEETGPVLKTFGEVKTSAPVPLSVAMAPARADRWLLAVQVDDLRFHDVRGYTGLAGYSFRNRVDVLAGWGGDGGKLQVGLRF